MNLHQEYHITVEPNLYQFDSYDEAVSRWGRFCRGHRMKPLWIELSNFERQLMCAASFDPADILLPMITGGSVSLFTMVRRKHEVNPRGLCLLPLTRGDIEIRHLGGDCGGGRCVHESVLGTLKYFEAHVKLNGPMEPRLPFAVSRDLLRADRWYCTKRSKAPFDPAAFESLVRITLQAFDNPSSLDDVEYEACLVDTNPMLDARWLRV